MGAARGCIDTQLREQVCGIFRVMYVPSGSGIAQRLRCCFVGFVSVLVERAAPDAERLTCAPP
jgi:hypothetical protein